jgi:type III pantothenate kinase
MKSLTLVVDIGNTSTSLGLHRAGRIRRCRCLPTTAASGATIRREIESIVEAGEATGAVLCSVVPGRTATWQSALKECVSGRVMVVTHRTPLGIKVTYPDPKSIGPDRLANACGAVHRYGAPIIVADFGTALTFDVVSRTHGYVGGVIAPGLPLMFDYLAEKTALLPHIEPASISRPYGKNTTDAMRIGARYGYRGMVREILAHVRSGVAGDPIVCATGGYAGWVLRGLGEDVKIDADLTLAGLGRIGELNGV